MKPGYSKYVFAIILFFGIMSIMIGMALLTHHEISIFD